MLAVVTGASGHLGANLVRALISRGWNVRALVHRDTRAIEGLDTERASGDVLNRDSLRTAFAGADFVFHLAARISVTGSDRAEMEKINIDGVRNVVAACLDAGIKRLVHTSSFHALNQEPLDQPLDESRPLFDSGRNPPYNYTKAKGQKIVRNATEQGLDAVIINPTGMIGPYDFAPSHFGATLLMIASRKLPALVDAGLNWVDTRDVAGGMIAACEKGGKGKNYILGGHWVSLEEISRLVSGASGTKPPGIVLPLWLGKTAAPFVSAADRLRGNRPLFTPVSMKELESNRNVSHTRASRELGYEPRPFRETIADTMEWFKTSGYLNTGRNN